MESTIYTRLLPIALRFDISGTIDDIRPLGEGFINDTYLVYCSFGASSVYPWMSAGASFPTYILQRKNHHVFPDVPAMMDNIWRVTYHIREKVEAAGGDPLREVLTVVPTTDDRLYVQDAEGNFWTMCLYISGSVTYSRADSPALAYKGGVGIGRFQAQLADFEEPLHETIKGFHNIRFRFEQWDEVLRKDPVGRAAQVVEEISWIESRREKMLGFWKMVEDGRLPLRVTHNDTKISNILFDTEGEVLCAIDLDTCMRSTALNDVGDALRSYTNTGAEDDKDLSKVGMSMEMYKAYIEGYLSEAKAFLTPLEIENLPFSGMYITYEQVLRFLMDYIDGDNYYKIAYPDHNLVRTRAQHALLESMEKHLL